MIVARTNGHRPNLPPRSQRNCGCCDYSRLVGNELRCWVDPPEPCNLGSLPPLTAGGMPRPVIVPIQRPTLADYWCSRWEMRTADHWDYRVEEEPAAVTEPHEELEALRSIGAEQ